MTTIQPASPIARIYTESNAWSTVAGSSQNIVTSIRRNTNESDTNQTQLTGLHLIHGPPEPKVIIVAIHGPNGAWQRSWRHPETKYFWLQDALPKKIPFARVFSFAYRGQSVFPAAADLLGCLVDELPEDKDGDLPIIFVGHSLGGLIAKEAFLSSHPEHTIRERYHRLHDLMKSFVFIATDHYTGISPKILKWSSQVNKLMGVIKSPDPLLFEFPDQSGATETLLLNHKFAALGGEQLVSACFWETEPTRNIGFLVEKPMAILNWRWVHNEGLQGNHFTVCQFEHARGNCSSVVGVLKDTVDQISPPARSLLSISPIPQRNDDVHLLPSSSSAAVETTLWDEGLRILSLDGGGVKGLFAVIVLQAIMEEVRKIDSPDNGDPLRPCDYFDFICGTSTGGLLAIMLGRLRMDLASCKDAYRRMSSKIFSEWRVPLKMYLWDAPLGNPWYSGKKMEAAIKDILSARISPQEKQHLGSNSIPPEEAPMLNKLNPSPQKARTIVCAVQENAEGKAGKCERLRAYDCNDAKRPRAWSGKIWQACRATSAAPVYFEHIEVDRKCYFDGGLNSNNPIREVYDEAKLECPNKHFEAIVSIGTGKPPYKSPPRTLLAFFKQAMHQMTDTEVKHVAFLEEMERVNIGGGERLGDIEGEKLSDRYFRLNDAGNLHKIDLAAYNQLDKVERFANDFVSSAAGSKLIQDCAGRLAFHRPIKP